MKKKPNKKEREYLGRVAELGCCICGMPAEVHHKRDGTGQGLRASHFDTMPLCPTHHRTGGFGVAFHAGKKTWQELHGTQEYWINWTREQLI